MNLRPLPDYARVSKSEFARLRGELMHTARVAGFDEEGTWNILLRQIEERHDLYLRGRRKTELTLAQAVKKLRKAMIQERASMMREASDAAKAHDALAEAVAN